MRIWLRLHTQLHRAKDLLYLHQQVTREHRETNQTPNPRDLPIATSLRPTTTRKSLSHLRSTSGTTRGHKSVRSQEIALSSSLNRHKSELNRSILCRTDLSAQGWQIYTLNSLNQRERVSGEEDRRRPKMRDREKFLERMRSTKISKRERERVSYEWRKG